VVAVLLAAACGGNERPKAIGERDMAAGPSSNASSSSGGTGGSGGSASSSGGNSGSGGDGASGGGGGTGGSGGGTSAGVPPVVELLQPEHENAPDEVYDVDLPVSCLVEASDDPDAAPPDPSTVSFDLIDEEGEVLDTRVGVEGDEENIYEATFPVQNHPSGTVTVRCSAADSSANPETASDEASTFLDHGPVITIVSPEPGSPESARGAVVFEYEVTPDELVDDDEGAALDELTLTVRGRAFPIDEVEEGIYRTTIDFADTTIFPEVPEGSVSVLVSASNARGIARTARYDFLLDSTGPELTILEPSNGQIVAGTVTLRLGVPDDGSGVDLDTLVVILNNEEHHYSEEGNWRPENDDVVAFDFESREVKGSLVQINVNVSVSDLAGNRSSASTIFYRDEFPPIVSLDPPYFRRTNLNDAKCSHAFDPLGKSPEPGQSIQNGEVFRVLAWETTNDAGGDVLYYAGVDPERVELFARTPDEPIVADTTGDGVCDDINEPEQLRFQSLAPVKTAGSPWFGPEEEDTFQSEFPMPNGCEYGTANKPDHLCSQHSDLYVVPHHSGNSSEAVVYALPDLDGEECTGRWWEIISVVQDYDGWICIAARAFDNVGNRGVSKPIPICLDNGTVPGQPSCATSSETPPDCQGSCDDPPELGPPGMLYRPQ